MLCITNINLTNHFGDLIMSYSLYILKVPSFYKRPELEDILQLTYFYWFTISLIPAIFVAK